MVQIPILAGAYADEYARWRASYPYNLEPVLFDNGLSKGFLGSAPGITAFGTGPGADRGGFNWNGSLYRAMGDQLVSVSSTGTVTNLGAIAGSSPVSMDCSFDLLGVAAGGNLYYWDGFTLAQVTDPDLGTVVDMIWIDGYFMTTDGVYLVVTELNDPYAVDPLKYGSSETDPDGILGLIRVGGEVYALNRYTIENFRNIGGTGFPFQRNQGAMIPKGVVGTHAKAPFIETFAFVGGGRNEAISVYLAGGGEAIPISTPEIDLALAALTNEQQLAIRVESRRDENESRLYIHLPDKTLVYLHNVSQANGSPVWHYLASGVQSDAAWPISGLTLAYGKWVGGTATGELGFLDTGVETQFDEVAGWQFDTVFLYNEGHNAIVHDIELVGLPGRAPVGDDPTCWFSMTTDGVTWGQERAISTGKSGQRHQRIQWRPHRRFDNYIGLRFRGASTAMNGWSRLEARVEALS